MIASIFTFFPHFCIQCSSALFGCSNVSHKYSYYSFLLSSFIAVACIESTSSLTMLRPCSKTEPAVLKEERCVFAQSDICFQNLVEKVSNRQVQTSPAKFIFTRWCTGYMHTALVLLYWPLTFWAGF